MRCSNEFVVPYLSYVLPAGVEPAICVVMLGAPVLLVSSPAR
jgi:hypothetical protein